LDALYLKYVVGGILVDKMYLLVYLGQCASKTIHGVKFTAGVKTANIGADKAPLFVGTDGKSLYDDIGVTEIIKEAVTGEPAKVVTAESLKSGNTLEVLQGMASERELDTTGSKTELAERIVAHETEKSE
jgi:hypothetical protein